MALSFLNRTRVTILCDILILERRNKMYIVLLAASLVAGFCAGGYISKKERAIGTIVVDDTEESPFIFLEIDKNHLVDLELEKTVVVRVEHRNYISQK